MATGFSMSRQQLVNKEVTFTFQLRPVSRVNQTKPGENTEHENSANADFNKQYFFYYPRCFTEFPFPACTSQRSEFNSTEAN